MNQRGLKAVSLVLAAAITCASVLSGCAKSNGTQSTAASPASKPLKQTNRSSPGRSQDRTPPASKKAKLSLSILTRPANHMKRRSQTGSTAIRLTPY